MSDELRKYLLSIEDLIHAEHQLAKRNDSGNAARLESALDAAQAAWRLIPTDVRSKMEPPPTREDYWPSR